jgi:hypothetical protein
VCIFKPNDQLVSKIYVIRKDVVFKVGRDLRDPCIGTSLSFWILRAEMHGVSCNACNPWRAPCGQDRQDRQLRSAGLAPFAWVGCPSCRLPHIFPALHQELEPRWRPWLTSHLPLHSPHGECDAGLGPQSAFLACVHGADRWPTADHCSNNLP